MSHRILHVVRSLDRYSPAADLLALVGVLPADAMEQHLVVLGRNGPLAGDFAAVGINPKYLEQRWTFDPTTLIRLTAFVRKLQPHLVHTWDDASRDYAEFALRWARDARLVAQRDHVRLEGPPRRWPAPRGLLHPADRWITASKALRDAMRSQIEGKATCTVVPLGVAPPSDSTPARDELLAELHLPPGSRLIGVAGPLLPRYGVKELIWAADMVRVLHPSMRFLIVGDGPQRGHLERFAHTAAEPENICFLGDSDRWPAIIPHLDVYWQGTEAYATSPTTLLEAMAAGVPVVASATPQHREIITDGQTGYLVGIDARAARTRATDELFNNAETARTIGEAGREHIAKHYSLAARGKNMAALYAELLK